MDLISVEKWIICWFCFQIPSSSLLADTEPVFSLFTTTRYTSPSPPATTIQRTHIPLLDRHIARLRSAWAYFSERDGEGVWGAWPGDDSIWERIKEVVEASEKRGRGDWRVSILSYILGWFARISWLDRSEYYCIEVDMWKCNWLPHLRQQVSIFILQVLVGKKQSVKSKAEYQAHSTSLSLLSLHSQPALSFSLPQLPPYLPPKPHSVWTKRPTERSTLLP